MYRSSSRSRICSGDIACSRAAASSMPNGSPSTLAQMPATAAVLSSVSSNPGTAAAARSTNSATASKPGSPCSVGSASASGNTSGDSRSTHSPPMPRVSRLVARIRSSGQARSSASVTLAASSTTCSQLSRTRSSLREQRKSIKTSRNDRAESSRTPRVAATTSTSSDPSRNSPNSTSHTPSPNTRRASVAARSASRVLPTPPIPVNVTRRDADSKLFISDNSVRRPTKLVNSSGRLPIRGRAPAAITRASGRPASGSGRSAISSTVKPSRRCIRWISSPNDAADGRSSWSRDIALSTTMEMSSGIPLSRRSGADSLAMRRNCATICSPLRRSNAA